MQQIETPRSLVNLQPKAPKDYHDAQLERQHSFSETSNSTESRTDEGNVSLFGLFRFATGQDFAFMAISTFGGLGIGAATPIFIIFWGGFTDVFQKDDQQIVDVTKTQLLKFVYLGIGTWVLGWAMIACWMITGERQAVACREAYFGCLLRQENGCQVVVEIPSGW